jgi:hypothetical protein
MRRTCTDAIPCWNNCKQYNDFFGQGSAGIKPAALPQVIYPLRYIFVPQIKWSLICRGKFLGSVKTYLLPHAYSDMLLEKLK